MERAELARLLGAAPSPGADPRTVAVVAESDPARFAQALGAAAAGAGPVFLADPGWGPSERAALAEAASLPADPRERGWLMIPSGGTGGRPKFARHDGGTLAAAVRGFQAHAGVGRINGLGLLPLHHVSGLMAWMRCLLTGGEWRAADGKRLSGGDLPALPGTGWFLSLVPTQLQRLMASPAAVDWLRRFDAVFIGGGPLWPELADAAASAGLPLSPSYGLTETAAMVAALPPAEFLAGGRGGGRPLPHARVDLTAEGTLRIRGESVCRGYYPHWDDSGEFATEDLGRIDEAGVIHVLGRRDALIITGGKKVDPAEVEAALRATGQFADVAVVGAADPEWGQAVVACYPAAAPAPDLARAAAGCAALASFKRPRRYVPVAAWPRNALGKLNRAELLRLVG